MQKAEEAMTPIESTFSLDIESKLDWCVSASFLDYFKIEKNEGISIEIQGNAMKHI